MLARGNVAAKQCTLLISLLGVQNEGMGMATQNGASKDLRNRSNLVTWGVKQCQTIHFDFSHQSLAELLNCQFWVLKNLSHSQMVEDGHGLVPEQKEIATVLWVTKGHD